MRKWNTFESRTRSLREIVARLRTEDKAAIERMKSSPETTTNRRQIQERLRALSLYAELDVAIGRARQEEGKDDNVQA